MTSPDKDPFDADRMRRSLAKAEHLSSLRATYEDGFCPELEDMRSSRLWDELSSCSEVPGFRIRRLKRPHQNRKSGFDLQMCLQVASFDNSLSGWIKRKNVDAGRLLLDFGKTMPLNAIVVARRKARQ